MRVEIVFDDLKDKELVKLVEFTTPFFVDFIDAKTKEGKKNAIRIKSPFAARKNPFVVLYDEEDKFIECFYSEETNAVMQFIKKYGSKN